MIRRWLVLASGAALLVGCASPYRVVYPNYSAPNYFPPSPDVLPSPYVIQPPIERPWPAPAPLYPAPEPMPAPEATIPEQTPEPFEPFAEPSPEPAPGFLAPPEPAAPARPPPTRAEPGADAPLQGFRPMRGQTRPGI